MTDKPDVHQFPVYKPNPLLALLPAYLKDPDNYEKVQKALLETLASKHSHADILAWGSCVACQRRIRDHAEFVRKLGFTSPKQFYAWKRVHETIKSLKRDKLPKYDE